jgi:hypothetical protein
VSHRSEDDAESLGRAGASASSPAVLPLIKEQCWKYLRAQRLGRLAIVMGGRPQISAGSSRAFSWGSKRGPKRKGQAHVLS